MSRNDSMRVLQLLGPAAVPQRRGIGGAWLAGASVLALAAAGVVIWLLLH